MDFCRLTTILALTMVNRVVSAGSEDGLFVVVHKRCPEFRSIGGIAEMFARSGIHSYLQCKNSFLQPSARLDTNAVETLGVELRRITREAVGAAKHTAIFCKNIFKFKRTRKDNQTMSDRQVTSRDLKMCANEGNLDAAMMKALDLLRIWRSRCSTQTSTSRTKSSPMNLSDTSGKVNLAAEDKAVGLVKCIDLVDGALDLLRKVFETSYATLRSTLDATPKPVDPRTGISEFSLAALHSLQSSLRRASCLNIFLLDAKVTFAKLGGIHQGLRRSFKQLSRSAADDKARIPATSAVVMCSAVTMTAATKAPHQHSPVAQSHRLCSSVCHDLNTAIQAVLPFLNTSRLVAFRLLLEAKTQACMANNARPNTCLDITESLSLFQRRLFPSATPQVCLNLRCHFPLRETNISRHWFQAGQTLARKLNNTAWMAFPNAAMPDHTGSFNCGLDCVSTVFTGSQDKKIRIIRFIFGVAGTLSSTVAAVAFLLNRKKLKSLPRRINFYFNLAFLIGPGTDSLLAASSSPYKTIACNEDNTLQLSQPGDSVSYCAMFGVKFVFGAYLMAFFGLFLSLEWYRMIRLLQITVPISSFSHRDSFRNRIYLATAIGGSGTLTAVLLVRKSFVGTPSMGGCFLNPTDQFYFWCLPFIFLAAIMATLLTHGLPILLRLHKGVSGYIQHIRYQVQGTAKKRRRNRSKDSLENIMTLLLLYNIFILASQFVIVPIYAYLYAVEEDVKLALERRLGCLATSCDPQQCPPRKLLSPAIAIMPDMYANLLGLSTSLWALRWKGYWHSHIERVCSSLRRRNTNTARNGRGFAGGVRQNTVTFRCEYLDYPQPDVIP